MAERFDAMRFSGPIGRLIAETQERQIAVFLAPIEGRRILDVGTGTGRAALMLARDGARVTGVDASDAMLAIARERAEEQRLGVTFALGDAHANGNPRLLDWSRFKNEFAFSTTSIAERLRTAAGTI